MFIKQIQINHNADALRDGQLIILGQYGVLAQHRKEQAQIKLNNVNYNMEVLKMAKINKENEEKTAFKNIADGVYSAAELSAAARHIFKTTPEIVRAALKQAGKTEAAVTEAKEIVNKFLYKEVK